MDEFKFDEIGYWSEVKLDIIRKYAAAYSSILSSRKNPSFKHFYIDAFAGAGVHKAKASDRLVAGSPTNALAIEPPFHEYHFIDLNPSKAALLEVEQERPLARSRRSFGNTEEAPKHVLGRRVLEDGRLQAGSSK